MSKKPRFPVRPGVWRRHPRNTGCIGHWAALEGSDGILRDFSGFNRHATINTGVTWVSGERGRVLSFNGSTGFASIGDLPNSNVKTFTFWMKPGATLPSGEGLIDKYVTSVGQREWRVYVNSTDISLQISSTGSNNESQNTVGLGLAANGPWVHIGLVYQDGNFSAYKNGDPISVTSSTFALTSIFDSTRTVELGRRGGSVDYFDGFLDDIRIFNIALPQSVIKSIAVSPLLEHEWIQGHINNRESNLPSQPIPAGASSYYYRSMF